MQTDGSLHGVNWIFNGWGACGWASWDKDEHVATFILNKSSVPIVQSLLVQEGGGIHTNGKDTVLLTETVQMGEGRNKGKFTKEEIEHDIKEKLGVTKCVWLKRGLSRDYEDFGTRGHVDMIACFCNESTILYHDQQNPAHPDYEVSREIETALKEQCPEYTLIPLPAPLTLKDHEGFVDYSYINHYTCNGAVILCGFEDPSDANAVEIIKKVYPGREVVLLDARPIFERGGGIHCITQQQPKARSL